MLKKLNLPTPYLIIPSSTPSTNPYYNLNLNSNKNHNFSPNPYYNLYCNCNCNCNTGSRSILIYTKYLLIFRLCWPQSDLELI